MYSIIQELRNTSSINDKIKIIEKYSHDDFKKVLHMTYDPRYVFGIKKIPEPINKDTKIEFRQALEILETELVNNKIRGKAASEIVAKILGSLDDNDQEVIKLILGKDLKAGINKKLIQKVYPDLIQDIGYMGAVPYDPKKLDKLIEKNVYIFSQEKMDGEYSNLVLKNLTFFSRNNKVQNMPKSIVNRLMQFKSAGKILNGELIIEGYDRYTSNGLLTRIFKYEEYLLNDDKKATRALSTIEEIAQCSYNELIGKIKYYIWDYQDSNEYYARRFIYLKKFLENNFFRLVENKIFINNKRATKGDYMMLRIEGLEYEYSGTPEELKKKIFEHFNSLVSQDKEGTIVKSGNEYWKNGKPVFQIKMKFEFECEMKIVGFKQGTLGTKYENSLGALKCESSDGKVACDSSGITEDLRQEIWDNQDKYYGEIISVKCNGLSRDKDGNYSLLHPRFIKFRDDKDEADDLETIIEIEKSIKKYDAS